MAETDLFSNLPLDVVFQILSKLPTKSLLQLRCVSKSFHHLISHPHFLKLHFSAAATAAAAHNHHLLYYESTDYSNAYFSFHVEKSFSLCKTLETPFKSVNGYLRIVGSTRGVVCLFDTNYFTFVGTLILWNPFIGKFKILPCPEEVSSFRKNLSHMVVGFGFDHRIDDFKVVKILYDCDNEHESMPKVLIYEVKIGIWRSTQLVVPCYMAKNWSGSVFVNGAVHWLAYKKPSFNGNPDCVMAFDVVDEVFKSMDLPSNLGQNLKEMRLSPLVEEKSLALFVSYHGNLGEAWDFWLMTEYGDVESWTISCTVVLEQIFIPLRILDDGCILSAITDEKLVLIDIEKEEVLDLEVYGSPLSFYADDYMPSLAMLDIGEQLLG